MTLNDRKSRSGIGLFLQIEIIPSKLLPLRFVGLLRYATFRDLFSHNNPRKFGGDNVEWLENQISEFYSVEDQKIYGVIGIEFRVCK